MKDINWEIVKRKLINQEITLKSKKALLESRNTIFLIIFFIFIFQKSSSTPDSNIKVRKNPSSKESHDFGYIENDVDDDDDDGADDDFENDDGGDGQDD